MNDLFGCLDQPPTHNEQFEQKLIKLLAKQAEINNHLMGLVLEARERIISLEQTVSILMSGKPETEHNFFED